MDKRRLSELMRKGAEQIYSQLTRYYIADLAEVEGQPRICACALGAALIGAVGVDEALILQNLFNPMGADPIIDTLKEHSLTPLSIEVTTRGGIISSLESAIVRLNDHRNMSILEIVKWLEGIEEEYFAKT